jgi:hypothetical protein
VAISQGGKPHLKVTDRSPRNQTALRARRVIKQSLFFFRASRELLTAAKCFFEPLIFADLMVT